MVLLNSITILVAMCISFLPKKDAIVLYYLLRLFNRNSTVTEKVKNEIKGDFRVSKNLRNPLGPQLP